MRLQFMEQLYQQLSTVQHQLDTLKVNAGKTSNILFGLTGSGKSSLLCYLLGCVPAHRWKKGKWEITHDQKDKYPLISNQMESCTEVPNVYAKSGQSYVDIPGFGDTRGSINEIRNSFGNKIIFKRGNRVRVVIVVEQDSIIGGRGNDFVSVMKRVQQCFNPLMISSILHSFVLVVSKVDPEQITVDELRQQIGQIKKANKNLSKNSRLLIEMMVLNNRIILFPIPTHIQDQGKVALIHQQIQKTHPCYLIADPKISLKQESVVLLRNQYEKLTEQLKKQLTKLQNILVVKHNELKKRIKVRQLQYLIRFSRQGEQKYFIRQLMMVLQIMHVEEVQQMYKKLQFINELISYEQIDNGYHIQKIRKQLKKMENKQQIKQLNDKNEIQQQQWEIVVKNELQECMSKIRNKKHLNEISKIIHLEEQRRQKQMWHFYQLKKQQKRKQQQQSLTQKVNNFFQHHLDNIKGFFWKK